MTKLALCFNVVLDFGVGIAYVISLLQCSLVLETYTNCWLFLWFRLYLPSRSVSGGITFMYVGAVWYCEYFIVFPSGIIIGSYCVTRGSVCCLFGVILLCLATLVYVDLSAVWFLLFLILLLSQKCLLVFEGLEVASCLFDEVEQLDVALVVRQWVALRLLLFFPWWPLHHVEFV